MILAALLLALLQAAPARPDIVIIVGDDIADSDIDDVSAAGWTPSLDALAAEGVRYRRAYSHGWCAPTRDSMDRSRWLGVFRGDACALPVSVSRDPNDLSIAEVLDGQGYNTAHIGKWHLGVPEVGDWQLAPELEGYDRVLNGRPVGESCGVVRLDDGVASPSAGGDETIACRDAFVQWWTETPSPRFAIVNFAAGHAPFKRPPPSILPPGYPQCPHVPCTNREAYEAEIAGLDVAVGQIAALVGPSTWIVFLGDNGTPGIVPGQDPADTVATRPEQDPARVKLTCYEDGIRVPLIVRGPGVVPSESQALVHVGVDLLPTLARIVNIQPRPDAASGLSHGLSFAATFLGPVPGPRPFVFAWSPPPRLDRAAIGRRWKLLTRPDGVEELYDLLNDPLETTPLPPTGPEADKLRVWRDGVLAGGSGK